MVEQVYIDEFRGRLQLLGKARWRKHGVALLSRRDVARERQAASLREAESTNIDLLDH